MDSECCQGQGEGWEMVFGCFKVAWAEGESDVFQEAVVMLVGQKERASIS